MKIYHNIYKNLIYEIERGYKNFIIYPYGEIGSLVRKILDEHFNIKADYIIDDMLCKYNNKIHSFDIIKELDISKYKIINATQRYHDIILYNMIYNGVPEENIVDIFYSYSDKRVEFAYYMSKHFRANLYGCVAECGVWRGDFAYFINKFFYDRKCYLFDTFEGFLDIDVDMEIGKYNSTSWVSSGHFSNTSVDFVKKRMPHPENLIIRKGRVPDSLYNINDKFCFVSLDMDIYYPTFEALKIFYPLMEKGGVILIHDFFATPLSYSMKMAINNYENAIGEKLFMHTIGDNSSIVIVKK